MSGAIRLINTHDQLTAAGGGPAITSIYTPGRDPVFCGWGVYRVNEHGKQVVTDAHAAWYNHGNKVFHTTRGDRMAALQAAKDWVANYLGEPGPWVRNRMRDYVPRHINERFPLVKPEVRPVSKPELRDGAWKNT
jgi:hypothetical protein